MKPWVVTLTTLVMVLLGAGAVQAVPPDIYTLSGSGDGRVGYCDDFEVWEAVAWEVHAKDFYDRHGDWVRSIWQWSVEGLVFNYDEPDNYLPYTNIVYTEFYAADTGEDRITGLWALLTVPGSGVIFLDVGLVMLDPDFNVIWDAGKHQWWDANVDFFFGSYSSLGPKPGSMPCSDPLGGALDERDQFYTDLDAQAELVHLVEGDPIHRPGPNIKIYLLEPGQ